MKRFLAVLMSFAVASCADSDDAPASVSGPAGSLVVDIGSVTGVRIAGYIAHVAFTLRNTGSADASVPRCDDTIARVLERREGDTWVRVATIATVCPAIYPMAPLILVPNATHADGQLIPTAGTYRLLVVYTQGGTGRVREAHSAPFVTP
jgi:hypothetical protein